jgi:hypothetical protein
MTNSSFIYLLCKLFSIVVLKEIRKRKKQENKTKTKRRIKGRRSKTFHTLTNWLMLLAWVAFLAAKRVHICSYMNFVYKKNPPRDKPNVFFQIFIYLFCFEIFKWKLTRVAKNRKWIRRRIKAFPFRIDDDVVFWGAFVIGFWLMEADRSGSIRQLLVALWRLSLSVAPFPGHV